MVLVRDRDGTTTVYTPAPQTSYDDERPERAFILRLTTGDGDAIDALLAREERFDPDCWVVELEPARLAPADLLDIRTP